MSICVIPITIYTLSSFIKIWDDYNNYSPPIIAFWGASRRRIWTKIGGNESQDLPGPP